jgi:hypothetical protein
MPEQRYYSDDDPETGITREALQTLSPEEQRDYILHWFGRNYEDPAEETPYNGREGGYQYINGGPFDAREELWSEFEGVASEELIEEVANEIESDGIVDWSPVRGPDDYFDEDLPELPPGQVYVTDEDGAYLTDEDGAFITDVAPEPDFAAITTLLAAGVQPHFGDAAEIDLRKSLLEQVGEFEREVSALNPEHGGIGHNRPPRDELTQEPVLTAPIIDAVEAAVDTIKSELGKDEPDAAEVARAGSLLQRFGHWCAGKGDTMAEEFAKAFGKSLGTAAGVALPLAAAGVLASLTGLLHHAAAWFLAVL